MPKSLRTPHYLSIAAAICWALYLIFDYLGFHGRMLSHATSLPYLGLIAFYGLGSIGAYFLARRKIKAAENDRLTLRFRGIGLYGLVLLAAILALAAFHLKGRLPDGSLATRIFYFSGYASLHVVGLFLLVIAAHGIGTLLLGELKRHKLKSQSYIAIALGISVLGTLFSIIGLLNMLTPIVCWVVIVLALIVGYPSHLPFLRSTLIRKREVSFKRTWALPAILLLVAVMGVNFVGAFKTFPIGFDGASLYMNTAMLTADGGGLPFGGQAFSWSVMMALGEILFGSLTMSILMSHLMNVLCLLLLYPVARRWLSPAFSLLACLLTAIAPFFAFHSLVDEKVDLAFTFIALAALELVFSNTWARPPVEGPGDGAVPVRGWLLVGFLVGFAFTIKYTAVILVIALGAFWLYQRAGKWAYAGGLLTGVGLLFASGVHRLGYVDMPGAQSLPFGLASTLLGLGLIAYSFRNRVGTGVQLAKDIGLFTVTFLLAFAPWGIKNVSEHGSISVNSIIQGKPLTPPLEYIHQLSDLNQRLPYDFFLTDYQVPTEPPTAYFTDFQQPTQSSAVEAEQPEENAFEVNQGAREDVQRYLGYEAPFWRYLSLPYDMTVNKNLGSRLIDIGFLGLLFLPLFFLLRPAPNRVKPIRLLLLIPVLLYLAGVAYSMYAAGGDMTGGMNALSKRAGFAQLPGFIGTMNSLLAMPILLLSVACSSLFTTLGELPMWVVMSAILAISLLLTLTPKARLSSLPRGVRELGAFLAAYATLFWIMGNGVIWYAMPLFLLAPVFYLYFFDEADALFGKALAGFTRKFGMLAIGLTVLLQFTLYFTSPFENENDPGGLFRYPFVEMASSTKMNERKVQSAFNPAANEILDILNKDRSVKVYRVSTQLGHFIKENDRRVFSDPVLERYDQISSRLIPGEEEKFFDMLKAQGYKYILFDLRLGNVDRTPEQNLKRKFISFIKALATSDKTKVVSTDNMVADPKAPTVVLPNGQRAQVKRALAGKTLYQGTVALLEIK